MEKLDELIEILCEHIKKNLGDEQRMSQENIVEMTKALAELVSARAMHD